MIKLFKTKLHNFLIWSQKYTKTDNIYLAKGQFWLTLEQTGTLLAYMILAVIWARFVPKEIYGQYKFVLSVAGILAVFSLYGMDTAAIQTTARGFDGTIKPMLKTKLRWSTLALLGGFILAIYYWTSQNNVLAVSFLIAGAFTPFINTLPIYNSYLAGKKRFDLSSKYSLIRTFAAAILTISAIFLTKNVIYLVLVYFLTNTILHLFFYYLTFKKLPAGKNEDQKSLKFGKHLSLIGVLGEAGNYIDKILVFHYLGAAELAVYSFATLLPDYIGSFVKNLKQLALPKLSEKNDGEIKKTVLSKVMRFAGFLAIFILIYILAAGLIFKIFFPAYLESVPYSKIYAIAVLGNAAFLLRLSFVAKAKTSLIYKHDISLGILKILILFASLYYFGLMGIILGQLIISVVGLFVAFYFFRRL